MTHSTKAESARNTRIVRRDRRPRTTAAVAQLREVARGPVRFVAMLAMLACGFAIVAERAAAQSYLFEIDFVRGDAAEGDQFGWAVDVDGERAISGAPFHDALAVDSGAAYVFRKSAPLAWALDGKLVAPNGDTGHRFGAAVAISDIEAAVGSPRDDATAVDAGAVELFRRGLQWQHVARVEADDAAAGDFFGSAVAILGTTLVVGAPRSDDTGADSGAVYVFENQGGTWVQVQKISNPAVTTPDGDFFGSSVSLDGGRLAIGAPRADPAVRGAAYVYENSGGSYALEGTIVGSDLADGDQFGTSVSISGDDLAVGSVFGDSATDNDVGAVYLFEHDLFVWNESVKLLRDAATRDRFGQSVAIDGDRLVAGAYLEADGGSTGVVYLFERDAGLWGDAVRTPAAQVGAGQNFGFSVAIEDERIAAGAPLDDASALDAGAAWQLDPRDCREGAVDVLNGPAQNVLFVNGGAGNADREVTVSVSGPIIATMSNAPQGGNGKYFVHANTGAPTAATTVPLPSSLGTVCFEVLLGAGASPVAVFNAIGKEQKVGESMYFDGSPATDPLRAPSLFLDLPGGDSPNLPAGTIFTLQGALLDPGSPSPRGVSLTNAVVVNVQ